MGLSLLSDIFQFDLGGFFIHIQDGFIDDDVAAVTVEEDEINDFDFDVDNNDSDGRVGNDDGDDDDDDDGCLKGGNPRERRGKGGIMFDGDDDDDDEVRG